MNHIAGTYVCPKTNCQQIVMFWQMTKIFNGMLRCRVKTWRLKVLDKQVLLLLYKCNALKSHFSWHRLVSISVYHKTFKYWLTLALFVVLHQGQIACRIELDSPQRTIKANKQPHHQGSLYQRLLWGQNMQILVRFHGQHRMEHQTSIQCTIELILIQFCKCTSIEQSNQIHCYYFCKLCLRNTFNNSRRVRNHLTHHCHWWNLWLPIPTLHCHLCNLEDTHHTVINDSGLQLER